MVKKKQKNTRLRKVLRFCLNPKNEYDRFIMSIVKDFKSERDFTRTVRQGLHLIWDLRQGKVDYLLELFPSVKELLELKLTPPPEPADLSNVERFLERIEAMIAEQGATFPPSPPLKRSRLPEKKPPMVALPVPQEDDGKSSENLLDAFL